MRGRNLTESLAQSCHNQDTPELQSMERASRNCNSTCAIAALWPQLGNLLVSSRISGTQLALAQQRARALLCSGHKMKCVTVVLLHRRQNPLEFCHIWDTRWEVARRYAYTEPCLGHSSACAFAILLRRHRSLLASCHIWDIQLATAQNGVHI